MKRGKCEERRWEVGKGRRLKREDVRKEDDGKTEMKQRRCEERR